jgi:tetratricopeptide (TPR) repeat protein
MVSNTFIRGYGIVTTLKKGWLTEKEWLYHIQVAQTVEPKVRPEPTFWAAFKDPGQAVTSAKSKCKLFSPMCLSVERAVAYKLIQINLKFTLAMKQKQIPRPGYLSQNPKLSVCMIVRDEENTLARCLKSVQGVAHELIVVDTGSKDRTISIAKDFEAKVFFFEWRDDFAAARNETLKHATGDWVLHIDADEELMPDSVPHLRDAILETKILCYYLKCDNGPLYEGQRYHWLGRLMRNHPNLRFHRPYHEGLDKSITEVTIEGPLWEVKYAPNIVIYHDGYVQTDMRQKDKRGLSIMRSDVEKNPDDVYILIKLGGVCSNLGHLEEAEAYLMKALDIDSTSVQMNVALGANLLKQKRPKAAIKHFGKALAGDPSFVGARSSLGAAYIEAGMLDKAIAELRKALTANPELGSPHRHLGWAYTCKGLYDDGIAELKKAVAIDPGVPSAHLNLAIAYMKKGDLDHSIAQFKIGLRLTPDDPLALTNLGVAYERKGMFDEAIAQHKKAISLDHRATNAYINLGTAYYTKGMFDKAIAQYKVALGIDSTDAETHYNLAIAYYAKGDCEKAIKHSDHAMSLGAQVSRQFLDLLESHR